MPLFYDRIILILIVFMCIYVYLVVNLLCHFVFIVCIFCLRLAKLKIYDALQLDYYATTTRTTTTATATTTKLLLLLRDPPCSPARPTGNDCCFVQYLVPVESA